MPAAALHTSALDTAQKVREDRAIYRAIKMLEDRLKKPGEHMGSTNGVREFLTLRLAREEREVFTALWLDAQNRLLAAENLFFGSIRKTYVHPREVVRRGLGLNAASVIFAHNHPSGNAEPSRHDLALTARLMQLLDLVDIRTLDHFIVAGCKAASLAELGLLGLSDFPPPKTEESSKPAKRTRKKTTKQVKK